MLYSKDYNNYACLLVHLVGRKTVCHVEGTPCLTSTEGCACVRSISNLYSDRVHGRLQRRSGRHSSTRDHLVSEGLWELGGGERVVLALGLGSGSIDNRPTVL